MKSGQNYNLQTCAIEAVSINCCTTVWETAFEEVSNRWNKLHRLTERDSRLAHYFGVWGCLGYLPTSSAKYDVIFLLDNPDFLWRQRNFARISCCFWDLTRDRQTIDDRQQMADNSKSSLVLPFCYRLPRVDPDKGPLNGFYCCWYVYC